MFNVYCEIILIGAVVLVLTWFVMNMSQPDGKFALKMLERKLDKITDTINIKQFEKLHFNKLGLHFYIYIEKVTPIKSLSYKSVYYKNVYINGELVCRLWHMERTLFAARMFEHVDKRLDTELFELISAAYKEARKINKFDWKEFNQLYNESIRKKSYFTDIESEHKSTTQSTTLEINEVKPKLDDEAFLHKYCYGCGSQRCEGIGTPWFEGCQYRHELEGYAGE